MAERRRRPTLRDIAAETGLSTAAVSYALRGLQVPPETQQRVREAAERIGYQADPIARALASGRTGYVGVLCRSLEDMWQQGLAAAFGRGLLEAGRSALIVDASNDPELEATLAQRLVDQRVDALIALPVDPRAEHWAAVAQRVPLVSIGDGLPGVATAAEVVFDNAGSVTDARTRLAAAGHRQITVLTSVATSTPDRPAESVVARVAEELGIVAVLCPSPYDLDGARAVAIDALSGAGPPTAFLCLAHTIANGG
jgi:LacI family transcriptional regulator